MSRTIVAHAIAGILFVGVGTPDAQESIPRPAVVEARETLTSMESPDKERLVRSEERDA